MKKKEPDIILRDHTYDGIEEFDQKLPNWWLFTLYITIVAFVVYWVAYYQLPLGIKSDLEKVDLAVASLEAKRESQLAEMVKSLTNESLMEMSLVDNNVQDGQAIYESKCLACHGKELNAMMGALKLPGVSLVDTEWKYGGKPLDIMNIVTNGSPDVTKGMIAWKTQLSPSDIAKVVAYVLSNQPDSYDPTSVSSQEEPQGG